jgi:outer membrane protein OmpA-like peptidoglycan-associated protein
MNLFQKTALFLLGLTFAGPAQAIDFKNRLSVGGSYGITDPASPGSFGRDNRNGQGFSGFIGYGLVDNLSLVASYSDLMVTQSGDDRQLRFRPAVLSLRLNLAPRWILNPYLIAGGGVSFNERERAGASNLHWNKMVGRGGGGIEIFVTQSTSFGGEVLYHQLVAENGRTDYGLLTYAGTINVYFGEGQKTKEAREAAAAARREADAAKAAASAAAAQSAASQAQATTAQAQAASAQAQSTTAQQQAADAQRAAEAANAARAEAERRASEMQNQAKAAQAEVDRVKEMIARKEMQPVQFKSGSAELLGESNAALNMISESMKKYPDLKLRVEGHTDSQGPDDANQRLSQRRAEAVKTYLTGQGLKAENMTAVGFGEAQPIADNGSADGRAKNRRVEFMVHL